MAGDDLLFITAAVPPARSRTAAARPPRKAEALQGSLGAARFSWALGDDEGLTAMGPNRQGKPLGVLLHLQVPKCH